jgi:hypothetical protein
MNKLLIVLIQVIILLSLTNCTSGISTNYPDASGFPEMNEAESFLRIAKGFYTAKKYKEAREGLQYLNEKYPDSNEAKEGKQLLTTIPALEAEEAQKLLEKAERAFKSKDYVGTEEKLLKLIERYPDSDEAKKAKVLLVPIQKGNALLLSWTDLVDLFLNDGMDEDDERHIISNNNANLGTVKIKMSQKRVRQIMGEPNRSEKYPWGSAWFYLTERPRGKYGPVDNNFTPIVFDVNNRVVGWGQPFLYLKVYQKVPSK